MSLTRMLPLLVGLAACGGNGGGPTQPGQPSGGGPALAASVQMVSQGDGYGGQDNSFSPGTVTIAAGGTVTWTNDSGVMHNVTFSASGAPANIPDHVSGSHPRTFPARGSYGFACTNHPGMNGQVNVE